MLGDVGGQDVEQQTFVVLPQLPHVLHLLPRLETPQEVQPRRRLQLPPKKKRENGANKVLFELHQNLELSGDLTCLLL